MSLPSGLVEMDSLASREGARGDVAGGMVLPAVPAAAAAAAAAATGTAPPLLAALGRLAPGELALTVAGRFPPDVPGIRHLDRRRACTDAVVQA